MLTNPFYVGVLVYNGEKHKGVHKQFISKALFDKVQEQVKFKNKKRKGHNFEFTGLIHCKECEGAITAEEHFKTYPSTRGRVRYVYYRCSKKLGKCSQPFLAEDKLIKQLTTSLSNIALPTSLAKKWLKRTDEEYEKDRKNCDQKIKELGEQLKEVDLKTSRLLDLYLEQKLSEELYKKKQNEFFVEKEQLETQLRKTKKGGSYWLEPMKEFIDCALQAQKIARKENTNQQIRDLLQKVGSNFFLDQKQIQVEYKKPFASLHAMRGAWAKSLCRNRNSCTERDTGIEPASSPWEGDILPVY